MHNSCTTKYVVPGKLIELLITFYFLISQELVASSPNNNYAEGTSGVDKVQGQEDGEIKKNDVESMHVEEGESGAGSSSSVDEEEKSEKLSSSVVPADCPDATTTTTAIAESEKKEEQHDDKSSPPSSDQVKDVLGLVTTPPNEEVGGVEPSPPTDEDEIPLEEQKSFTVIFPLPEAGKGILVSAGFR